MGMLMKRNIAVIARGPSTYQGCDAKPSSETYITQTPHHIRISPK